MILMLDAMETGDTRRIEKVEKAYAVFVELERKGVHKLAALAVERISWGLGVLKARIMAGGEQGARIGTQWTGNGSGSGGDVDMQGAPTTTRDGGFPGAAATHHPLSDPNVPIDTVMGNTGMLLLEDPGLQCFVPESFAPLTWKMAGDGHSIHPTASQAPHNHTHTQPPTSQIQGARRRHTNEPAHDKPTHPSPGIQRSAAAPVPPSTASRSADAVDAVSRSPHGSAPQNGSYPSFYTASPNPIPNAASDGSVHQLHVKHTHDQHLPNSLVQPMLRDVVQQDAGPQQQQQQQQQQAFSFIPQSQSQATDAYPSPISAHLTGPIVVGSAVLSGSGTPQTQAQSQAEDSSTNSSWPLYYTLGLANAVHPSWAARPANLGGAGLQQGTFDLGYGAAVGGSEAGGIDGLNGMDYGDVFGGQDGGDGGKVWIG